MTKPQPNPTAPHNLRSGCLLILISLLLLSPLCPGSILLLLRSCHRPARWYRQPLLPASPPSPPTPPSLLQRPSAPPSPPASPSPTAAPNSSTSTTSSRAVPTTSLSPQTSSRLFCSTHSSSPISPSPVPCASSPPPVSAPSAGSSSMSPSRPRRTLRSPLRTTFSASS